MCTLLFSFERTFSSGNRGLQLSWLERTPDKREVGGSSPLEPTNFAKANAEANAKANAWAKANGLDKCLS